MKNKQQVSDLLARVRCKDEQAESDIKKFLKEHKVRAKFTRDPLYPVIDYESFIDWYNRKVPEKGEIIILETGLIGIFNEVNYQNFILSISFDGVNLNSLPISVPICKYKNLSKDELLKFQHLFSEKGLAWNNVKGIVKRQELKNNIYYRISRVGVQLGSGVFREINDKGDVVFYCVKMNNKPVRFSLYEEIGKEKDFQFEVMNNKDRDAFAKELLAVNRIYNGYLKRIEPLHLRAGKSQRYYYINDIWEIVSVEDKYNPKDLRRFNRGNYFRTPENARSVLEAIETTRNSQMVLFRGNLKNIEDNDKKDTQ